MQVRKPKAEMTTHTRNATGCRLAFCHDYILYAKLFQFQRRGDTRRPRSDDQDICILESDSLLSMLRAQS
jgi:hypothetical protein